MKTLNSLLAFLLVMSSLAFSETLGEKDLSRIVHCDKFKKGTHAIKSCQKSILILRQPSIKVTGIVTGYYNNKSNYSVLWIRTNNGYQIGCLANANDPKFDNIFVGTYVMMGGKTHHVEKHKNEKYNTLLLARGCKVTR